MFSITYWFAVLPPSLSPNAPLRWGGIAIGCLIATVLLRRLLLPRITQSFARRPWQRCIHLLTTTGIVLLILLFFRYEEVPFLSSRFWLPILAVADLAWVAVIVREMIVRVPKQRAAWAAEQQQRKYLRR